MDLIEITEKHNMTREAAAKLLHQIADALERHNDVEFMRNGMKVTFNVPDRVEVEVEMEVEDGESSLEIELKW
ncbi:MAG: hypothetical protein Hals2KO_09390 [Halioglobus sp.]